MNLKELANDKKHPFEGRYVIVRANGSGVHSGYVLSYDDTTRTVFLNKSRRLWLWKGFTLSQVANEGMADGAKVDQELPEIMVTNVLELIPCSDKAIKNLSEYKVFVP